MTRIAAAVADAAGPFSVFLSAAASTQPSADLESPLLQAVPPRFLLATAAATTVVVPQVYASPTILMGLLLGLLLLFFTLVGLWCVMGVETPDVMHSFALPAGKEY